MHIVYVGDKGRKYYTENHHVYIPIEHMLKGAYIPFPVIGIENYSETINKKVELKVIYKDVPNQGWKLIRVGGLYYLISPKQEMIYAPHEKYDHIVMHPSDEAFRLAKAGSIY